MRIICGLAGLAAAGFLAASASGLNVPTVSTPTVTAPSVSVPSVSVPLPKPTLPKPTLPSTTAAAPTVTTAPVPVPSPPKPTLPSTTVAAPPTPPTPPATTASKLTAPAPPPAAAPVTSAAAGTAAGGHAAPTGGSTGAAPTRSYGVAGASHTTHRARAHAMLPQLRRVIARFTLQRPARIRISIEELAPVCRKIRTYLVRLPKGTHAFRFPTTRVTEIGTYRVTAMLRDHKIFSVRARRMHKRVKLGGTANVCRELQTRTAFSLSTPATLLGAGSLSGGTSSKGQLHVKSAHGRREAAPHTSAGQSPEKNPLVRAVSLTDAPRSLQPLLFTLLAIAIALLALAAAPQRVLPAGRAAAIVATRRAYFAAAGIWLLVVVAIVTALA